MIAGPGGEHAEQQADEQTGPEPAGRAGTCRAAAGQATGDALDRTQVRADDVELLDREPGLGQPIDRGLGTLVGLEAGDGVPGEVGDRRSGERKLRRDRSWCVLPVPAQRSCTAWIRQAQLALSWWAVAVRRPGRDCESASEVDRAGSRRRAVPAASTATRYAARVELAVLTAARSLRVKQRGAVVRDIFRLLRGLSILSRMSVQPNESNEYAAQQPYMCRTSPVWNGSEQREAGVAQHRGHVGRNCEPCCPSTSRWSKETASWVTQRGSIRSSAPAPHHPRHPADRAERHDPGLAGVEDRRAGVDAEHADVGDRDRAAGHVRRRWSCRPARSR